MVRVRIGYDRKLADLLKVKLRKNIEHVTEVLSFKKRTTLNAVIDKLKERIPKLNDESIFNKLLFVDYDTDEAVSDFSNYELNKSKKFMLLYDEIIVDVSYSNQLSNILKVDSESFALKLNSTLKDLVNEVKTKYNYDLDPKFYAAYDPVIAKPLDLEKADKFKLKDGDKITFMFSYLTGG